MIGLTKIFSTILLRLPRPSANDACTSSNGESYVHGSHSHPPAKSRTNWQTIRDYLHVPHIDEKIRAKQKRKKTHGRLASELHDAPSPSTRPPTRPTGRRSAHGVELQPFMNPLARTCMQESRNGNSCQCPCRASFCYAMLAAYFSTLHRQMVASSVIEQFPYANVPPS